ncbi:MAG: folate-binding protein [Methylococcales bacterium]|nr:folate-binding protein [Methylococcales bacterium]
MPNPTSSSCTFFSLNHLAVVSVTGQDSAKFLQGQLTCDINSLTKARASVAAFCNPKGRVISTLLVVRTADGFLLILPASLMDKVVKKLQMYVLRSLVELNAPSQGWRLFGLQHPAADAAEPLGLVREDGGLLKLSWFFGRELCISGHNQSPAGGQCRPGTDEEWIYQDITAGFPWFDVLQSEQYTPQMLNIDGLGGVSFSKGCYTGQEIVARTHYLGAAKRHLFVGQCQGAAQMPDSGMAVLDALTQQNLGSVLLAQRFLGHTHLLLVLQGADIGSRHPILDDGKQTAIKITHD